MTHQHHSLGLCAEKLFQPLYRLDVEMVGGLVEQQHVGLLKQDFCQLDPHSPSSRELTRRTDHVLACEAQSRQSALQLRLAVLGSHHQKSLVLGGERLHKACIVLALVVGTLRQLPVEVVNAPLHFVDIGKRLARLVLDGGVVLKDHHLRQIANGGVVRHSHNAFRGLLLAAEYLEEGRFACTVLSNKGDAVAVVDHETGT